MYNHILYFYFWLVNTLVLLGFGWIFPVDVVLGNWRFGMAEAAVYTGFWVTFLVWCFWDWAIAKKFRLDLTWFRLGYFGVVNVIAFWLASRLAVYSGFGITDFTVALFIAVPAGLLQQWVKTRILNLHHRHQMG